LMFIKPLICFWELFNWNISRAATHSSWKQTRLNTLHSPYVTAAVADVYDICKTANSKHRKLLYIITASRHKMPLRNRL